MAFIVKSNITVTNLRIGPLSGGGNGGGGGAVGDVITSPYLAVGAYTANSNRGAAYIYDANNLSATPTKLEPSGLDADDQFGAAVAATPNHIVVGAVGDDDQGSDAGAIYVYDVNNLSGTPTKLTPSGLGEGDRFGGTIAANSNYIAVGVLSDDDLGMNSGAAYIYDATNLSTAPIKLRQPGSFNGTGFYGNSVAVTTNHIVIGSYYNSNHSNGAAYGGAVFIYDANNLSSSPINILSPSGAEQGDNFGRSVAATTNHIVVGAYGDNDQGTNAGAVWVYDANNLSATPTKLTPSNLEVEDRFGNSVSVTSDHIIVESLSSSSTGTVGSVYIYDINNLSATPTEIPFSSIPRNNFYGLSLTASSNQIIVGASTDDQQGTAAGSVFVYDATNLSASPTKLIPSGLNAGDGFGQSVSLG